MRTLLGDEIDRVSGGHPVIPIALGTTGAGLYYAGGATISGQWSGPQLGTAMGVGLAVSLATLPASPIVAIGAGVAVAVTANYSIRCGPAAMSGFSSGGFGGGYGAAMGCVMGSSSGSHSCMGEGGGSY